MEKTIVLKDETITNCAVIKYPDGQRNIKLDMAHYNPKYTYQIKCRIKTFSDLELLSCLVTALNKNDCLITDICFCYLCGMRSDRAFEIGMPNYFRDIIVPILKSYNTCIRIFYPHQDYLKHRYGDMFYVYDGFSFNKFLELKCIRLGGDSNRYGYPSGFFSKKRDNDKIIIDSIKFNKILQISEHQKETHHKIDDEQNILVIDDLCDGGATFIQIAEYLKEHYPNNKRYLFVAHALFTKGVDIVAEHYEKIYCTNSYQDIVHPKVEVIDVWGE
jgi:ribose-phosphate pyrophosphokinase